jgi:PIN domain nuclease of toxin-antitoxin system
MKLLLDTHALLWFILKDSRLSASADSLIADPANEVYVSPASYWEIAIKINLGKYSLQRPYQSFFEDAIAQNDLTVLAIEIKHTANLTNMALHHRDPFDHMLIAQALVEQIPIISNDAKFDSYCIQRIW